MLGLLRLIAANDRDRNAFVALERLVRSVSKTRVISIIFYSYNACETVVFLPGIRSLWGPDPIVVPMRASQPRGKEFNW